MNPQFQFNQINFGSITSTAINVLQTVITFLNAVAVPVVIIAVLIVAYQMLFTGGDPERFQKGWKAIFYIALGYALLLLSTSIPGIIRSIL